MDAEVDEAIVHEACCGAEVVDLRPGPKQGHLSRSIPPAVRRTVLHRDKLRCQVPGCRCRLWLDVHHVLPWSEGGTHDADNLITLCWLHHRLLHEGLLVVEVTDGIVFVEHASGRKSWSPLGGRQQAEQLDLLAPAPTPNRAS